MGWNDWIRTVEVAPSLTAADPAAVAGQVEMLLRTGCRIFHIDDDLGLLERTAPLVHRYGGIVDVQLSDAESVAGAIGLGADSVTVAAVTPAVVQAVRARECQLGVVFATGATPDVDLVSIEVDDSEASVDRVRELATGLPSGVCVQVVGDLGHDSVRAFYDAGATVIVVGRSIFGREDLPREYRRLVQALA
jgi:orotidine-5'-phosphate decarboxylase